MLVKNGVGRTDTLCHKKPTTFTINGRVTLVGKKEKKGSGGSGVDIR